MKGQQFWVRIQPMGRNVSYEAKIWGFWGEDAAEALVWGIDYWCIPNCYCLIQVFDNDMNLLVEGEWI